LSPFWLKIEQLWSFEEMSIFSNGGHLGWTAELPDILSQNGLKFVLYEHIYVLFSSPGHRPYELLPSGFVRRPLSVRRRLSLAFHILIFSVQI
jgi:hypothetical protein